MIDQERACYLNLCGRPAGAVVCWLHYHATYTRDLVCSEHAEQYRRLLPGRASIQPLQALKGVT